MLYSERTFDGERVVLHGNFYRDCTFKNCELVYDGDPSPTFHNNQFVDSVFVFTGPALRTLYFLGNMYRAGEGGQEVVEETFNDIKMGNIHGAEASTIIPNTTDHSLKARHTQ
ncbi:hypothetical protein G8770_20015 [Aestuariicella hydrocarbonica]|uniref:Uncharacterized protein n=1 Tax=Pseudomaricurvus hydrocarbonicus TaxID=1470433 RepID=A0A9E5MPA3_9GAMM|nr:hypothetical protein [Aestuariicella hydrocarbonica]NHO67838.1 hypothetical protein [Aestuariicella hydrocarbonica]